MFKGPRLRTSLLTFATDLVDEGLEAVFDNVQHRGGAGGVTLAAAYHDARDVFPHNPRRVVYFQEPGAVFFQPRPHLFRGLKLQPTVSELIAGRDLVAELVAVARRRDMDANAWVVLLHVDRGREVEPYVQRNVFGDPYLTQLCPANAHVRAYARAVIADVASRGVDAILMESFHHFPFAHGYHHERAFVEITPLTSFLLSLCFCEACMGVAAERGVDTTSLRDAIRFAIRRGLSSDDADLAPIDDLTRVRELFGGELGGFLNEYAVGKNGDMFPEGTGRLVKAGAKIRFNMHYHPIGEETVDQTEVALVFYPKGYKPKYYIEASHTGDFEDLDLPAGVDNIRSDGYTRLTKNARITSFQPHLHNRGKAQCIEAIYPDGKVEQLNCVNNYQFGWHVVYNYTDEVQPLLPAGTMLHVISWHNNTSSNRYNPDPKNWAGFGQRSIDDMSFAWVNYIWLTDEDFKGQVDARKAKDSRTTQQQQ